MPPQFPHERFDLTDIEDAGGPVDHLDAVLDVAGEVLSEYGGDPGTTRIERMARWILCTTGMPHTLEAAGALARLTYALERTEDELMWGTPPDAQVQVLRCGGMIAILGSAHMNAESARATASMLLRAAEITEAD